MGIKPVVELVDELEDEVGTGEVPGELVVDEEGAPIGTILKVAVA